MPFKIKYNYSSRIIIVLILIMKANQNHAVALGFPVTASSYHKNHDCIIGRLRAKNYAWSPQADDQSQWIQVSSIKPQKWIGVITQGRLKWDQWVTQYEVLYSMDGIKWDTVKKDNGPVFIGNSDGDSQVRRNFQTPVLARTIRICPKKWQKHIALRFEAIFVQQ